MEACLDLKGMLSRVGHRGLKHHLRYRHRILYTTKTQTTERDRRRDGGFASAAVHVCVSGLGPSSLEATASGCAYFPSTPIKTQNGKAGLHNLLARRLGGSTLRQSE